MSQELKNAVEKRGDELREEYPDMRHGQALCNALHEIDPVLRNYIRGTFADPFNDDKRIGLFNMVLATLVDG